MAVFRDKTVKSCICSKTMGQTQILTAKNQVMIFFSIAIYICIGVAVAMNLLSGDPIFAGFMTDDIRYILLFIVALVTFTAQVYFTVRHLVDGHAIKCAIRWAFLRFN